MSDVFMQGNMSFNMDMNSKRTGIWGKCDNDLEGPSAQDIFEITPTYIQFMGNQNKAMPETYIVEISSQKVILRSYGNTYIAGSLMDPGGVENTLTLIPK